MNKKSTQTKFNLSDAMHVLPLDNWLCWSALHLFEYIKIFRNRFVFRMEKYKIGFITVDR